MRVVFRPENLRNVQPEMAPLLREHWEEIALDHEAVPLDPDWPRYLALNDAGCLSTVTARMGEGGPLVGYHVAIVSGHLHYGSTKHGVTDVYYISPEHRDGFIGLRMFRAVDEEMKRLGVVKRITGTKVALDIGPVLRRLGYRLTEHVYTKVLEV